MITTLQTGNARSLLVGLLLLALPSAKAFAQDEAQFQNLFAGMSEERAKLKSWSCTIQGTDEANGPFAMTLLSDGINVRFDRTTRTPINGVQHVTVNNDTIAVWDVAHATCYIYKSTPKECKTLNLWDPRTAGLRLDADEADYKAALANRLNWWKKSFTIQRDRAFRTLTFTNPYEWQNIQLSLTIDLDHGFTPRAYRADTSYKPNSKYPGKVDLYYEVAAKWEQMDGVWVPVQHVETASSGRKTTEYNLSWHWINRPIAEKEFSVEALELPANVNRVYLEDGQEVSADANVSAPSFQGNRSWFHWTAYTFGFMLLLAGLLYRFRSKLRKANQ